MKLYRVCTDRKGEPLSVGEHGGGDDLLEHFWLTGPNRVMYPDTPDDAEYVHYLSATDEMGAFTKAQQLKERGEKP